MCIQPRYLDVSEVFANSATASDLLAPPFICFSFFSGDCSVGKFNSVGAS